MRPQQQNRRMRGRNNNSGSNNNNNNNNNNRKGPNPLTRNYESNGPDVKIRGSAQQVAEKYMQLARDSQSSGDRVMAENYLQHAEHYNRIIAAAQAQMPVQQSRDDNDDDDDDRDDFDSGNNGNSNAGQQQHNNAPAEQPRHVNDGSGPQPVINGTPAEVAYSHNTPQPASGEQPRNGADEAGNGQPRAEGDDAPRRPRRPRRGRRPDLDGRAGENGGQDEVAEASGSDEPSTPQATVERTPAPVPEPDPVG